MSIKNSSPSVGKRSIAVVIAANNVQDHITRGIAGIFKWVKLIGVVNDTSPDVTNQVLQNIKDPRLHVIHPEVNQGVGGVILSGYALAFSLGAKVAAKMDGDGQMDADYLPALVSPILQGEADYAKGNRFIHTSELLQIPFLRRGGKVAFTFFIKVASGYWDISDPTNGHSAIEKSALSMLSIDQISRDDFFESNMLLALRCINAVIRNVPIPSRYSVEKKSLSISRVLFTFPFRLIKGISQRISREYFLFDFNAGSILLLFGFS
jgi:dolichol-phosphate mannosyltransferase